MKQKETCGLWDGLVLTISMGQERLSNAQPSKEVGGWLEVSAKPPAKDSVLSKRWGGFVSAEQGRVPGAALLIPIGPRGRGCSSSWASWLAPRCWERSRSAGRRSHVRALSSLQNTDGLEQDARTTHHTSLFLFFPFSLCYNPLMN